MVISPTPRSMSFELKCAVNSVALQLMLAPLISYSLPAVLACQHGGLNRMGHVTAGALLADVINKKNGPKIGPINRPAGQSVDL